MRKILALLAAAGLAVGVLAAQAPAGKSSKVVVSKGKAIQIAAVLPFSGGAVALGQSAANAVQMAVDQHGPIRGFAVQINDFDAPCGGDVLQAHIDAANAVVVNTQNVGVLGHACSGPFRAALPIYENAGVVTISGSATGETLPSAGPSVFNRTVVYDNNGGSSGNGWYGDVQALPSDRAWRDAYTARFGQPPADYADLYFDAANVLFAALDKVASPDGKGNLVIDRAALAAAVRSTTGLAGVSCTISIDSLGNRVNDPAALAGCKG
jgi:ABC-type branched-subunit amino acid transport system substrate-binding protein